MKRILPAILLSLVLGFAAGRWLGADPAEEPGGNRYFDASLPADARIDALERAVADERNARLVLEEEIGRLFAELERLDLPRVAGVPEPPADARGRAGDESPPDRASVRRGGDDWRLERMAAAGIAPDRAIAILERESALRMQALEREYEARLRGEEFDPWATENNPQLKLRQELGDEEYARYLESSGRRAAIVVADVIDVSPANRAGLRRGDMILSYDGRRVFSMSELKSQAFSGNAGENVIVDIERDGTRMQVVVPRGPLGISGRGSGIDFGSGG